MAVKSPLPEESYPVEVLAYTAGLIDGEGYVDWCSHEKNRPLRFVIQVAMTDENIVRWLHTTFGGSFTCSKEDRKPHWKDRWRWQRTGVVAIELYEMLRPYLRLKIVDTSTPKQTYWRSQTA